MVEVSTSLLSVSKDKIIKTIYDLEVAKTDYFHIDVMDGIFVNNFTNEIMEEYSEYVKSVSTIPLDVHLMVRDIKEYIDKYLNYEPNIITFHIESVKSNEEALELIKYIKENNCKVGIAVSPKTKISKIYDLLSHVHMILIMTVEPGEGGQKLIDSTLNKIKQLSEYILENNIEVDIEVDGGIKHENVNLLKEAGANIIVSGSGIIKAEDYSETIKFFKK